MRIDLPHGTYSEVTGQRLPMQYPFSCLTPVLDAIELTMSPARLGHYVKETNGDRNKALRLYIWNARLCEEFYLPIHFAEVACRNAIAGALRDIYTTAWFENSKFQNALPDRHKRDLASTVEKAKRENAVAFSENDVIAGMTFGFWAGLVGHRYQGGLWKKGPHQYFTNLPANKELKHIWQAMDKMRELRNDAFHHCPIFKRRIISDHNRIKRLLGWVCPETLWLLEQLSGVEQVFNARPNL